jgi:hypothetical protein
MELFAAVRENTRRMEKVVNDNRPHGVQFQIALRTGERYRRVVADHLNADHHDGLALGGVDFAGHDRRARFVGGKNEFAQSASRTRCKPSNVVGNLHQRNSQSAKRGMSCHDRVKRPLCRKLVGCGHEWQIGEPGDFVRNVDVKVGRRVQSGADRRSPSRQLIQAAERIFNPRDRVADLPSIPGPLLADGQRHSIFQVSTTDFDDVLPLFCLGLYETCQSIQRSTPRTIDTIDTIVSDSYNDMDESLKELLQYSTPEHLPLESSSSTPCSTLYHNSHDSELARVLNCDLALNNLTTFNTAAEIWSNLNLRCIKKLGGQDYMISNVSISDITWAGTTLPAYRSWNMMKDYYDDIDRWIAKINSFCKLNLLNYKIVLDYKILIIIHI